MLISAESFAMHASISCSPRPSIVRTNHRKQWTNAIQTLMLLPPVEAVSIIISFSILSYEDKLSSSREHVVLSRSKKIRLSFALFFPQTNGYWIIWDPFMFRFERTKYISRSWLLFYIRFFFLIPNHLNWLICIQIISINHFLYFGIWVRDQNIISIWILLIVNSKKSAKGFVI